MKSAAEAEYLRAYQVTCCAQSDRHEPGMIRCIPCGLFWENGDPRPPACRARASAEAQPSSLIDTSLMETEFTGPL